MDYLTQPSLTPTFTNEILDILMSHNQDGLAIAYYQAVSPSLQNPEANLAYFKILSKGSTTDAFYFSRSAPDTLRRQLLEILIDEVLRLTNKERASRAVELVDLPFNGDEQAWFEEYLADGDGRNTRNAADLVMMRNIATGRIKDAQHAMRVLQVSKRTRNELSWTHVMAGLDNGMGPRDAEGIYDWNKVGN